MHGLVAAVLLWVAWFRALEVDAQAEPPHREFAEAVGGIPSTRTARRCQCGSLLGARSLNVRPNSETNCSGFIASASHVSRVRIATSVIVSG